MYKKWTALALGVCGFALFVQHSGGQTTDPKAFMRSKLIHSQDVLEGLTTEDYDAIDQHANALASLSRDSDWNVIQTAEYRRQSEEFRRRVQALSQSAREQNLDGATLAYVQLTLNCVACHKHVRKVRKKPDEQPPTRGS